MRVDSQICIASISQSRNDNLRMESSPQARTRLDARFIEDLRAESANAISVSRLSLTGASQSQAATPQGLSNVAARIAAPLSAGTRSVATPDNGVASNVQGTAPAASNATSSSVAGTISSTGSVEASGVIHTPIGAYDANSINERVVFDVIGSCAMEVYFMTHAPGEWMRIEGFREEFVKLYGTEALVTVDRHGTVPKNVDPVWVTKPAVDTTPGRA